ncbi:MAG TPA: 3-isopropylmalate dehydratase small subunit [Armatimonadota bacterium]|nr:3-isopropylmalate dehydratase small subunit [Armatimonadota bacterium]HQK92183.1 3-isopropylmalate dehydratase small subunit [Armatimonadota bacterium]
MAGRAHKYGDHIDTDIIIAARYLVTADADELAQHCMEDGDAEFAKRVRPGDYIVAGENFGCGSSREHAPIAIKASGIACVVAKSFARIFCRNSINIGLPILICPEAVDGTAMGDELEVALAAGRVRNVTRDREFQAQPFPAFMLEIVEAGGLIPFTRARLQKAGARE